MVFIGGNAFHASPALNGSRVLMDETVREIWLQSALSSCFLVCTLGHFANGNVLTSRLSRLISRLQKIIRIPICLPATHKSPRKISHSDAVCF